MLRLEQVSESRLSDNLPNYLPDRDEIARLNHADGADLIRGLIMAGPFVAQLAHDDVRWVVSDQDKVLHCSATVPEHTAEEYGTPLSPDSPQYIAMQVGRRCEAFVSIQGSSAPLNVTALPVYDAQGQVIGSVALLSDVAAAMRREQEAMATNRRFQALYLVTQAVSRFLDLDQVFQVALDKVLEVMGLDMGVTLWVDRADGRLVFKCHRNMTDDLIQGLQDRPIRLGEGIAGRVAQTGQLELIVNPASEARHVQDGTPSQVGYSLACIPLCSQGRVLGIMTVGSRVRKSFIEPELSLLGEMGDQIGAAVENAQLYAAAQNQLCDIKMAQSQLVHAAKLSAVGKLVAGIAHELNNPLTSVIGYTQLLMETVADPDMLQDLERIHQDAQRSARIVRDLLVFSRQQHAQRSYASINEAIERTLALRAFQFKLDQIEVQLDLSPNLPNTMFDVYQTQQVFLNIMNNAQDSILRRGVSGRLLIRSQVIEREDTHYIRIEFIDNGVGLTEEELGHAFEPFFTCKDIGQGVGLGLSISYGIVTQHRGQIQIENHPAGGARVMIDLPVIDLQATVGAPLPREQGAAQRGRVLLVDDEESIVALLARLLKRKGLEVDTAATGEAAWRKLSQTRYDLIISDIKMPGMGGQSLYERVAQVNPDLARRIIFSTGDMGSLETQVFLEQIPNEVIGKPFNLIQVEDVLDRVLKSVSCADAD